MYLMTSDAHITIYAYILNNYIFQTAKIVSLFQENDTFFGRFILPVEAPWATFD